MFTGSVFAQNPEIAAEPVQSNVEVPKKKKRVRVYEQQIHEVSAWGAFGLSTLNYDLSFGEKTPGLGFMGGIGYNFYFNHDWSVGLGLEYSALSAESKFDNFRDNYEIPGAVNDKPLNLELISSEYKQSYNAAYLNIPITAQYQIPVWFEHKFYVAGGVKLGIPLSGTYKSEGDFVATAFERKSDGTNTGSAYDMTEKGFGNRTESGNDGDFDTKFNVILTIEPGMKWQLSDQLTLYTGVFLDYGLSNIRKNSSEPEMRMIQYDADGKGKFADYSFNNALESQYTSENGNTNFFTDRINTISFGIKLKLGFGFGDSRFKRVKQGDDKVTADDIDEIVSRNTQMIIDNQNEGFGGAAYNTQRIIDNQNKGFGDLKDALEKNNARERREIRDGSRLETISEFESNKTTISPEMEQALQKNVTALKSNPNMKVRLVGHTDDVGSSYYNMDLGMKRAVAVMEWLKAQGINSSRISVDSKGNTAPIVPNVDDANRKVNRRVEFIIVR